MPHLAAAFDRKEPIHPRPVHHVRRIRDISGPVYDEFKRLENEFQRLRRRFSLLFILEENYRALDAYIRMMADKDRKEVPQLHQVLRHLMNYIFTAYALREHLETALKRDFGRRSVAVQKWEQLLSLLETRQFPYAFFQDFRNFVQHCGFPAGNVVVTDDVQQAWVRITYSKKQLLGDYNDWEKSHLAKWPQDELDIVAMAAAHHKVITEEFPIVIVANYGGNLPAMQECFKGFHAEARKVDSSAVAVIIESEHNEAESKHLLQPIPKDALGELGLSQQDESR